MSEASAVLPYGGSALLVEVDDVLGYQAALELAPPAGVVEVVPAARTLLVRFDPAVADAAALTRELRERSTVDFHRAAPGPVKVPVRYDGEDLAAVAEASGLSVREVVERHAAGAYEVAFCGFAPGFAYLTGLDPALHLPRRSTPRTRVPAGSVAIAGEYSAVYPRSSPGGWHLLGRTGALVWEADRAEPSLLPPGTRVQFEQR
ncbi:allophanate hydrolase subunit 1 [Amycolatopsis sp. FDAARGOS 1241]|uniref:5-oxoprolinase subunit B family protein n=1 Tax=Amycolatopsis sp. FDAARGOS 1241 TaxID=2778070 RepID=UPI0019501C9C|nr:allophanate hydrolase subunit 1 [Amycolatopsis sp. FDAARGOS 1241]QRP46848.1 allophanate hydrolase subunit 1 [Amycolatopsis sp. FDAARGOS 1241]